MKQYGTLLWCLIALLGVPTQMQATATYFAKAKVQVSSNSTGAGMVYLGPSVQFTSGDELTDAAGTHTYSANDLASYDGPILFDENGIPTGVNDGVNLNDWFATPEAITFRSIDLTAAGSAQSVYAMYLAEPNPGYYLKGWSTINNDYSLGNANPFAYPVMSQAMTQPSEVKGVYMGDMPMGLYVAEGNGNRYIYVERYEDSWGDVRYRCYKNAGQFVYLEQEGQAVYIVHSDNVLNRVYVIDDDGRRVDVKDGSSYLPVLSNPNQSYVVMKFGPDFVPYKANLMDPSMAYDPSGDFVIITLLPEMYDDGGEPAKVYATLSGDQNEPIAFLPAERDLPQAQTIYATFAPVLVNDCAGGNRYATESTAAPVDFQVRFSTQYADNVNDFAAPVLTGDAGFAIHGDISMVGNEVIVPVRYTPSMGVEGRYVAYLTLSSAGGESTYTTDVEIRIGEGATHVAAVKNGSTWTEYESLSEALAAASGTTLRLLNDVADATAINGNMTIDMNGYSLNISSLSGQVLLQKGIVTSAPTIQAAGNVTMDGVTVQGVVTNHGKLTLKRGVFEGGVLTNGTTTIERLAELRGESQSLRVTGGTTTVNCGMFGNPISKTAGTLNFISGYFKNETTGVATAGLQRYDVSVGAAYEAGYTVFFGAPDAAKANDVPVCKIGAKAFATLEDALLYAQNNPSQKLLLTMVNDYTLPAGYYTLPANATLFLPYGPQQLQPMLGRAEKLGISEPYTTPFAFRTLTLASGVNLDVYGTIEVSCKQFIAGQGAQGNAVPTGGYGLISTANNVRVILEYGSRVYAWGYITGKAEFDARRGAEVYEDFQVYDWPGGSAATAMLQNSILSGAGAFPINQYFMQNIEAPVTYHPGSRMFASFGASAAGMQVASDAIQIVGNEHDVAMFKMDDNADADNTWVRKFYDVANDKQVYEVNSSAHLGAVYIEIPLFRSMGIGIDGFDSRNFILPITSNMKIHLLTGYMDITQNTEFLPGSELEINKESMVGLINDPNDPSNGMVFFIDNQDWANDFACKKPAQQVRYTPSHSGAPNIRAIGTINDLPAAKLNVHGTLQVEGFLFTTEHGANIFSNNEDAGTIIFPNEINYEGTTFPMAVPTEELLDAMGVGLAFPQWSSTSNATRYVSAIPALLRNAAGATPAVVSSGGSGDVEHFINSWDVLSTDNFTMPGESFCFVRNRWTKLNVFDEGRYMYDNYGEWYIKPADYVAVATTEMDPDGDFAEASAATQPLENDDHTFSDAAGEGRLFILVNDQWWEVTIEDNLYHGTNGKYYYYDEEGQDWMEKTYVVTFKNWDGSDIPTVMGEPATEYMLSHGVMPVYTSMNPKRAEDVDYTYTFIGWAPALAPVSGDATYTAQYEATQRKYTITFLAENGTEIEQHFLTRDEVPVCENIPTKPGYYLQWSPAIGAVTGDATYRAVFLPVPPTEFTVNFVNYDGSLLETKQVLADDPVVYTGAAPVKELGANSEFDWVFAGWNPAIDAQTIATEDITYTATFNKQAKMFTVRFFDENGLQIGTAAQYAYGATPAPATIPTKDEVGYTNTLVWDPAISMVVADADYTATFVRTPNKYTVSAYATGCTVSGVGVFDYGTPVELRLTAKEGFENPQWVGFTPSDGVSLVNGVITIASLSADLEFTASATPLPENNQVLVVGAGQSLTLGSMQRLTTLTLEANATQSAEITDPQNIDLTGPANFDLTINAAANTWYAISVPWTVDLNSGVYAGGRRLRPGQDFKVMTYNGAIRAAEGKVDACWENVTDQLRAGKLYMIGFYAAQGTVRFAKKSGADLMFAGAVDLSTYPSAVPTDAGWNGIANPYLYHSYVNAGVAYGQLYDPVVPKYDLFTMSSSKFILGKPIFVQAPAAQPVVFNASAFAPVAARQERMDNNAMYDVQIASASLTDHIVVKTDEDKAEDAYVIGEDLLKMGVTYSTLQLWVEQYNEHLCVNTMAPEAGVADYALGINAPQTGDYLVQILEGVEAGTSLYLTENGQAICNLSKAPYSLHLTAGVHSQYGLRISTANAPGIATSLDEAQADGQDQVTKVLVDGVIYILRGNRIYDALGRMVK